MLRNFEVIQRTEDLGLLSLPALRFIWRWLYHPGNHVKWHCLGATAWARNTEDLGREGGTGAQPHVLP